MKKIISSVVLLVTSIMSSQEVSMPTGEVCNNTEITAVAKAYHNESAITTGTFYFVVNQTGAFFKDNGGQELTIVVPASSGVFLPAVVNSGTVSGGLTVGFRINAPNYSPTGGSASTWVNQCTPGTPDETIPPTTKRTRKNKK